MTFTLVFFYVSMIVEDKRSGLLMLTYAYLTFP